MQITVCELPHDPPALAAAWAGLCAHARRHASQLVLLPECAFVPPFWESEPQHDGRWVAAVRLSRSWLERLPELGVEYVVGTRPVEIDGRRFNEGYLWTRGRGIVPLRRKFFMPDEPGGREARWFDPGDAEFPAYRAGALSFGLNICTELWALETWATYAEADVQVILSPRATGAETRARWLAAGVVAAVRSGAYSISSNRVEPSGSCGGAGWVISPEGRVVATTTPEAPFATVGVDLAAADSARAGYPRYVFRAEAPR